MSKWYDMDTCLHILIKADTTYCHTIYTLTHHMNLTCTKKNKEILEMNHYITYTTLRELHRFHCLTRCLLFKLVAGFSLSNEKEGDKIYNFSFRVLWISFIFIPKPL